MNRYPKSIRYAISTYSNNPNKKRNISETQRIYSQGNSFSNSIINNHHSQNENPYDPSPLIIPNDYKQISYINNNKNEIRDEYKNKTEARQLIEQTKKMMEEYSLNKIKNKNNENFKKYINYNNIKKNSNSMSNFGLDINNNNRFNNNDENYINKSAILSKDRFDQLAGTPNSVDDLTKKLILKNKEIKILEKELKEKTNQLKNAQDKIASKNEEIKKLLETLDNERSNSLKVENSKLNKKIYNLEKNNIEIIKNCDKNLEDLKFKLNDLNKELINYQNRNKELENKNLILRNDNEKLRKLLDEKNNLNLTLKEKNDIEKKSNEINNIEINNLKMNLSNIIVVLKTLFNKESQIYDKRSKFLKKLNNLKMAEEMRNIEIGGIERNNYNDGQRYINNEQDINLQTNFDYNGNI